MQQAFITYHAEGMRGSRAWRRLARNEVVKLEIDSDRDELLGKLVGKGGNRTLDLLISHVIAR